MSRIYQITPNGADLESILESQFKQRVQNYMLK